MRKTASWMRVHHSAWRFHGGLPLEQQSDLAPHCINSARISHDALNGRERFLRPLKERL
jgi:hypothetical protein